MDKHRFFLVVSLLLVTFLNTVPSLAMKYTCNSTFALNDKKSGWIVTHAKKKVMEPLATDSDVVYFQPQTTIALDRIVDIAAASGDGLVVNKLQQTCRFMCDIFSKKNSCVLSFISNPLFASTMSSFKDLDDIRVKALWYGLENKNEILAAINKKLGPSNVSFELEEDLPRLKNICRSHQIDTYFEEKFPLYWQKDFGAITFEEAIAVVGMGLLDTKNRYYNRVLGDLLFYATFSDDRIAMKTVSLKIKNRIINLNRYHYRSYHGSFMESHWLILSYLVSYDKAKSFEFFVKEDPYCIIDSPYKVFEPELFGQQLFLDYLSKDEFIPQGLKDKYGRIYQEYCSKAFPVVKTEKQGCIIC